MTNEQRVLAEGAFSTQFNHTLHAYIDIADDLIAGTLLSQIVYWHTESKNGDSKLRIEKNGHYWLVKSRDDWRKEIRISAKQYDRAIKILKNKNLVIVELHRFNDTPIPFIRLVYKNLDREIEKWKEKWVKESKKTDPEANKHADFDQRGKSDFTQRVKTDFDQRGKSTITEITTEITSTENTCKASSKKMYIYKASSKGTNATHKNEVVENQVEKWCGENGYRYDKEVASIINLFIRMFEERYEEPHGNIPQKQIGKIVKAITRGFERANGAFDGCYDIELYEQLISDYFDNESYGKKTGKKCDHRIYHFINNNVRQILYERCK